MKSDKDLSTTLHCSGYYFFSHMRSRKHQSGQNGSLLLRNLRCFETAQIPFDNRMTVIVGENGSGKTTIIEALAGLSEENDIFKKFSIRGRAREAEILLHLPGTRPNTAHWQRKCDEEPDNIQRLTPDQYLFVYGKYRRGGSSSPDSPPV